jgi:hypothetical protein
MLFLTQMWIYFSTVAGGGVHGMGAGIARKAIIQAGPTIKAFPLFTERSPPAGGMTTGSAAGAAIHGTTREYHISRFNKTGVAGKKTNIGRSKTPGVSRV